MNLINKFNQLKKAKEKQKEEEIKSKLEEEKKQKLFIFNGKGRKLDEKNFNDAYRYIFVKVGEKKEEETLLWFPINHPSLNGFEDNSKVGNYYLIDGLEKVPTQPHHVPSFKNPCKYPKLEDKITIAPYDS